MILYSPTKSRLARSGGFTLVEMLVVIMIIIVLVGLLLPALNIAMTHATKNRMAGDINTLSAGLEAYRSDQRTYPQLDYTDATIMSNAYPASVLLCWALIGPSAAVADGAAGPGFTTIPNGQVYGPYVEPSQFKMALDPQGTVTTTEPTPFYIQDRYGHPILYFKAFMGATPFLPAGQTAGSSTTDYVGYWLPANVASPLAPTGGPQPRYNLADDQGNTTYPALCWSGETPSTSNTPTSGQSNALIRMCLELGDKNANGVIEPGATKFPEQPATTLPFLLWSPGPDEVFGVSLSIAQGDSLTVTGGLTSGTWASMVPSNDDATNFR